MSGVGDHGHVAVDPAQFDDVVVDRLPQSPLGLGLGLRLRHPLFRLDLVWSRSRVAFKAGCSACRFDSIDRSGSFQADGIIGER